MEDFDLGRPLCVGRVNSFKIVQEKSSLQLVEMGTVQTPINKHIREKHTRTLSRMIAHVQLLHIFRRTYYESSVSYGETDI